MNRFLKKVPVLAGLVLLGGTVFAQDVPRDEAFWRGHLFQRVREDLDRIQQSTPKLSGDEYRLVTTKHDLDELQSKMDARRYDEPALDRTIAAVERVSKDNTLNPHDRVMLDEDLRRLRDFRGHHEGFER